MSLLKSSVKLKINELAKKLCKIKDIVFCLVT